MDKLTAYAHLLEELVVEWGSTSRIDLPDSTVEDLIVVDQVRQIFFLVSVGWRNNSRIQTIVFHARIKEGKIWIEKDNLGPSITEELWRRGVPREDVVLAWQTPAYRAMVEHAAGD